MKKITGIYAAMLTPFDKNGKIDKESTKNLVELLIRENVDGIFPVSSIGESVHLSLEESVDLIEIVIKQVNKRVKIIPGVTSTSLNKTVKLATIAKQLGCDTVVIAPPFYFPNTQDQIFTFYKSFEDSVDIDYIVYNIPLFTTKIEYTTFEKLTQLKNIVGIKDSSGNAIDFMNFRNIIKTTNSDIGLLIGREEFFLGGLFLGADGCMVGSASIIPQVIVKIRELFLKQDYEKALFYQDGIVKLVRKMFELPFPLGFKLALESRGISMGNGRKPITPQEEEIIKTINPEITLLIESLIE